MPAKPPQYEFLRIGGQLKSVDDETLNAIMKILMTHDLRFGRNGIIQFPEKLPKDRVVYVVSRIIPLLLSESTLIEIDPPVVIVGDTHGQFIDLLDMMDHVGKPPDKRYLCMGDYIDRGDQSIELILFLYILKLLHPKCIYFLRGNHETSEVNCDYGFKEDCLREYDLSVWDIFQESFKSLSLAAVVGSRIICMHGGLSPHFSRLDDLRNMPRPFDIPMEGLVCDLLWSDPTPKNINAPAGFTRNITRGTSYWFDDDVTVEFLMRNDLDLVVRGHELSDDGYDFTENKKVLTIFSAPNYCGYFNKAAILLVDAELRCQIMAPSRKDWHLFQGCFETFSEKIDPVKLRKINVFDVIKGPFGLAKQQNQSELWNEVTLRPKETKS